MQEVESLERIRVLVNRKSGLNWSLDTLEKAIARYWERPGRDVSYAFSQTPEDGCAKARRAVAEGADVLLVGGGDGSLSSMGTCLIGSEVSLGAIPLGSGNGFARHFEIPLALEDAVEALADASVRRIDVGVVNDRPFLITCSMAWDADLVRVFDRSPVRGILPYIFAGVYTFFDYRPQPITVMIDDEERFTIDDPMVFTVANLSQYGCGAVIAPDAEPDDGSLELIAVRRQDMPSILGNLDKLFTRRIAQIPRIIYRRFKRLRVLRPEPCPIQIDGELVDAPAGIEVHVTPRALNVRVPNAAGKA